MEFNAGVFHQWHQAPPFPVDASRSVAYALASDGDPDQARSVTSPLFAAVPIMPAVASVLSATTPWYKQWRGLHVGHDLKIETPIEPGMVVHARGRLDAAANRKSGALFVVRTESHTEAGELLNTQYLTVLFPNGHVEKELGELPQDHILPETLAVTKPLNTVRQTTAEDQTFRYATPSGDFGEYHLWERKAKSLGLQGIIVHGLCTLAFAVHGSLRAVSTGDFRRLSRVATRFSKPVYPTQELTTEIWAMDAEQQFAFQTTTVDGLVLRDGRLELRD